MANYCWLGIFFLFYITIGCPTLDIRPWSISSDDRRSDTYLTSLHLRSKREVTLSNRSHCGEDDDGSFDKTRVDTTERVQNLLAEMKKVNVDAYIIPASDEHLSEYISDNDKRRDYISGFKGSAGTAVVVDAAAILGAAVQMDGVRALWTDGRYFLQAEQELDCNWLLMKGGMDGVPTILEWLKTNLKPNSVVGTDPKLISAVEWKEYDKGLNESSMTLKSVNTNLIDVIWPENERPPKSDNPIKILELKYAGKAWVDKVADLRKEMKEKSADLIVVTAMDENAWLFNLRGGDVPYTPVFRSYALIDQSKIRLFLDKEIGPEIDLYLHVNQCDQECVEILNYKTIIPSLRALASEDKVKKVIVPSKYSYSGGASYAIYSAVPESKLLLEPSPVLITKARKNDVEARGMRNAHLKDAVALIDFLSFMEEEIAAGKEWDEITAANRLTQFRAEQVDFHSLSFNTISAFGSNGAIIHYRPAEETKKVINDKSLYLLDSGGQYKDGTTDVTRTLHYGTPTEYQKETYTRVLKGALDVAMLIFPKKTKDTRVDVLARKSLFEVGLDYKHGTGHGIGMYLNIHEAPIQMRIHGKEEHELEVGHFFSDEPGYYKPGDFGIRLETILSVVPVKVKYDEEPMLGFVPVTLVPFEAKLIIVELLNRKQCEYLNLYHSQIRKIVGRELEKQERQRAQEYMNSKTEPLNCSSAGAEDAQEILNIFEENFSSLQEDYTETPVKQQQSASHGVTQKSSLICVAFGIALFFFFTTLLRR